MTTAQLLFYLASYLILVLIVEKIYRKSVRSNPEIDVSKYVVREAGVIYSEFREKRLAEYKRNRLLAHFVILSFYTYLQTKFPGYLYFLVFGLLIIQSVFRSEKLRLDQRRALDSRLGNADSTQSVNRFAELQKNRNIAFVIAIVVCFGWYIQIQENANLQRESFLANLLNFEEKIWCHTDEYRFDEYGDMYYAGWPCVEIGKISDAYFKRDWFNTEACVKVHLDREIGFPGQNRYLPSYRYDVFCIPDEQGFSIDYLEDAIREGVAADLKDMQTKLCRDSYSFSNSSEFSTYCFSK